MSALPSPGGNPRRTAVLMYHALARGAAPPGQDPHYTLDMAAFERQLARIVQAGGACSLRDWVEQGQWRPLLLTFDDGHASNYGLAYPTLAAHGLRADFFVNPAHVGTRGFASWAQLREMADGGMSIQSHGYDHSYFTDMDAPTLRDRLQVARRWIEDETGRAVTLLAPPGGRMPPGLAVLARECGYRHVVSSRPGCLSPGARPRVVPRLAVTTAVDPLRFAAWIEGGRTAVLNEQLRYGSLSLAKRILGNARYERARTRVLSGRAS